MADLPIQTYKLESRPEGPPGIDAYRWRVWLEEDAPLWVHLSGSQAVETQLGATELHDRLPEALQRHARGRLANDVPVLDQVVGWDVPVVLQAEHFA